MQILVVKLSSIGDVVHTLPAAAALKAGLPDAVISWAVEHRAAAILRDSPAIDDLIEVDLQNSRKNLGGPLVIKNLKRQLGSRNSASNSHQSKRRFDIAIDFQGLIKSGLVTLASNARRRLGFETADLRERPSRLFLTDQVDTIKLPHVIQKNLALAQHAISLVDSSADLRGAALTPNDPGSYEFPIAISRGDEIYADELIEVCKGRFAIVNPGGGWGTKLWSAQCYGRLTDWLAAEYGIGSVVTCGPGEEALARSVLSNARSETVIVARSTLKQFAALARRASLFVGGDSGPLHIAAACKTPIVGLYGPTSPRRNGPFDPRDVTVGRDIWCREDCHRRSCWHWECMDIPVSEVQRAIEQRLLSLQEKSGVTAVRATIPRVGL